MRKSIVLGVVVATVCSFAPAAWAGQSVPTCLIANGGSVGRFTKSLICVELLDQGIGHAGSGSYSAGDNTTHWLTETVEFQSPDRSWLPLTSASERGSGQLHATTRTVLLPAPGALRACTQVGTGMDTITGTLCSRSD
jgi:hypothetical protein